MSTGKSHPAYGCLRIARSQHGKNTPLFGSSIEHMHTIHITLSHAKRDRTLHRDYIYPDDAIVELEMSNTQFADLITSIGDGDAIPCTIRYLNGKVVEQMPPDDRLELHRQEFAEHLQDINARADALAEEVKAIFDKKTVSKKDKEDILKRIENLKTELGPNTMFQLKQFDAHMERTVHDAEGEIEAFMQHRLNQLAMQSLSENEAKSIVSLIEAKKPNNEEDTQ